jgi:phytoene dehydrogenase-like protein
VSRRYDAVAIGSGINSLVAAALLAKGGWSVCVLERNDWLGGAIRTAEITEPGFVHDVFACWHPLFTGSAAYAQLKDDLEARGLEYLNTELPTGTLFPDGSSSFLTTSHQENVDALGRGWERTVQTFMPNADLAFGVLSTELWSRDGLGLGAKALRRLGRRGLVEFAGNVLTSCRDWTAETFEDERARGLFAPWVLHTGLGPDAASSGFMAQVIGVAIELGGMPVPRGGGTKLVEALAGIVGAAGGTCETERHVERILVAGGRATGVRTADGETVEAARAVLANVTPQQLYGELLGGDGPLDEARRFRYGRAEMQIHFALSEPPRWQGDDRLGRTAIVHLTPGLDGVSRAVNEADRGLLPAEATVVVGQPAAVDPARAPDGSWILWIQLQELPSRPRGDAAGELDTGDGTWT